MHHLSLDICFWITWFSVGERCLRDLWQDDSLFKMLEDCGFRPRCEHELSSTPSIAMPNDTRAYPKGYLNFCRWHRLETEAMLKATTALEPGATIALLHTEALPSPDP